MKRILGRLSTIGLLMCCAFFAFGLRKVQAEETASGKLQEILEAHDVMALVYLSDTQPLMNEPDFDGKINAQLPTGQTVFIRDVSIDEFGNEWVKIETHYGEEVVGGYMLRDYLACADKVFLDWESSYVPQGAYEAHIFDSHTQTYEDIEMFPESYKEALYELKEKHPDWVFVRMDTGLNWNTVVENQLKNNRSLIYKSYPEYMKLECYDEGNWYYPTREILEYYLDPRSGLTEEAVFQFELLTYNKTYHTQNAVEQFLGKTFMNSSNVAPGTQMTYALIFWAIGAEKNVSPFHLAARVYQEQGSGTSSLISGKYPGYEGYYNYFNVKASGTTNKEIIENGLKYAKQQNWNSAYYSILGGSQILASSYITKGQDTLYLQKYNVNSNGYYPLFTHQYMQNIAAPTSEGRMVKGMYDKVNALDNTFVFKIPVYSAMPPEASGWPVEKVTALNGVDYAPVYDPDYYRENHTDVAKAFGDDYRQLLSHFVNYGMAEGRQAKADFNVYAYRELHADVVKAFGEDIKSCYLHYINSGLEEGRQISGTAPKLLYFNGVNYANVFEADYYVSANPDVAAALGNDENALLQHFVLCGMTEGRRASHGFDVHAYKNKNADLAAVFGEDLQKYYLHYIEHGYQEGRNAVGESPDLDYALVFDAAYYASVNPDVAAVFGEDETALFQHFKTCGMAEGRIASESFDVHVYREKNPDVKAAFPDNLADCYLHYVLCGYNEGRVCK